MFFKCETFFPRNQTREQWGRYGPEENTRPGASPRLRPSQKGSRCSLSLFSHTSGFQKLKAFSVSGPRESVFVMEREGPGRSAHGPRAWFPPTPTPAEQAWLSNERCNLAGPRRAAPASCTHCPHSSAGSTPAFPIIYFIFLFNSQSTFLLGGKSLLLLRNHSREITGSI